uniref:Uncharacterized protein n=1 Tax=Seriola lalandi dorsalis TaxID=1841481 RepID=A0A3B4Y751_SERLL
KGKSDSCLWTPPKQQVINQKKKLARVNWSFFFFACRWPPERREPQRAAARSGDSKALFHSRVKSSIVQPTYILYFPSEKHVTPVSPRKTLSCPLFLLKPRCFIQRV